MVTVGTTLDGLYLLRNGFAGGLPVGVEFVDVTDEPESVEILWHRHSFTPGKSALLYPQMPRLLHVHVDTAGTDHIDDLVPPGVTVSTAHAAQTAGVAEWVVASVLWDAKRLDTYQRNSDSGHWSYPEGVRNVHGRTLASFGAGQILQQALPALRGLGINVVATSRRLRPVTGAQILPMGDWVNQLPGASWLLLDAPLTDQTRHAITHEVLAHLDQASLISLSRGDLLAPGAVGWARRQGHLRSAVLDVHRQEPLPSSHPAWGDPRVLVTPHDAWRGDRVLAGRVDEFAAALGRLLMTDERFRDR